MFIDWIHWFSSMPYDLLLKICAPLLMFDGVRYALGAILHFLCDVVREIYRWIWPDPQPHTFRHCPSVCMVVAGLNEADTIGHTLASAWGTYPRLEVIIVDDGSNDGMSRVAQQFADEHPDVLVLRKPERGGKSSALNFALPFTKADIIVCVDGDSHLRENALWEIVQPFEDPHVTAVAACVLARNPFVNLVTWLQAFEYLQNIFIGRMLASAVDMLGIISGAFGAYRRDVVMKMRGWDVGPGEDGDMTLRMRKYGYRVVFAPYAQCLTNVPVSLWRLMKQRRRWEWAVIRDECRKHVDMSNIRSPNFRLTNLFTQMECWIFNVALCYASWAYLIWLFFAVRHDDLWKLYFLYYLVYTSFAVIEVGIVLYFSDRRWHDLKVGLVAPFMAFYHLVMRAVTLWSITEEIFTRRSCRDNFVPPRVRQATWHW